MNKALFIESIEAIRLQSEHDRKCSEAFAIILPDSHPGQYNNDHLREQLIKVLQKEMGDNIKDSWITYFIYELDFGAKYYPGCATEKNGGIINLSTSETLYYYLIHIK